MQPLDCPSMARRLATANAAKSAMLEVDSSKRLRRALLRRSRPHRGEFPKGASVYFWRRRNGGKKAKALWRTGWQGPAVVIATQGQHAVWIGFRGQLLKCSPEMLRLATPSESLTFQELLRETENARALLDGPRTPLDIVADDELPPFDDGGYIESPVEDDLDDVESLPDFEPSGPSGYFPNPGHPLPPQEPDHHTAPPGPRTAPETPAPHAEEWPMPGVEPDEPDESATEERPESARKRLRVHLAQRSPSEIVLKRLSPQDRESFRLSDEAEWKSFLEHQAVQVLTPQEERRVLATVPSDLVLSSRTVRADKNKSRIADDGSDLPLKAKSRAVIRGFEDSNFEYCTDAPTLSTSATHLLCMCAAGHKLRLVSADISTAFLNGHKLDRELYMRLPQFDLDFNRLVFRFVAGHFQQLFH